MSTANPHDSDLLVVTRDPFNAETVLPLQVGVITPNRRFYVRSHFPVPNVHGINWTLDVSGLVHSPLTLHMQDLQSLARETLRVTLECAGNGRQFMDPVPPGEPWQYGAVSTAEWTGVPLRRLLDMAGVEDAATEVIFEGADRGMVADIGREISYTRSLPIAAAHNPFVLLAFAMNGEDLPPDHGYPLRLIVPGWYGMASVKWLTAIRLTDQSFTGFYQLDRYVIPAEDTGGDVRPLTSMAPRSLIIWPDSGSVVRGNAHMIRGVAWSGAAPIESVEVSADAGQNWDAAKFISEPSQFAWRQWEYELRPDSRGEVTLCSRATDSQGNQQPRHAEWNRLGYVNNGIQSVTVFVYPD